MQRIKRVEPNIHPILDEIEEAYRITSDHDTVSSGLLSPTFDRSFEQLFGVFSDYGYEDYGVEYVDKTYQPLPENDNKSLILSFSGGKDSVASAIKYKNDGYDVHLYHLKHINVSFFDEDKYAQRCADVLGLPIHFDEIHYSGKHIWMEHPMKNMLIANGALSYGIREGITTNIAFGNYYTSYLADNPFDRCAGDCMDMWGVYENIIHRVLPNFKIRCNLSNMGETLDVISKYPEALESSLSCLCRHSLRPYRNEWVYKKFGVRLASNRCGSCYKCAIEYLYLADHNHIQYSDGYYKYCLDRLMNVYLDETGYQPKRVRDIWDRFIFYEPEKSHLYDKFDDAMVYLGGIRWEQQ